MTDREQFEQWVSSPPFEYGVARHPDDASRTAWPGQYCNIHVQLAWQAWQQSKLDALKEAAGIVHDLSRGTKSEDRAIAIDEARGAILVRIRELESSPENK